MSIFSEIVEPRRKTLAEKKQEVAQDLINGTQAFAVNLVGQLNQLFAATWAQANQYGLTPPQVAEGLGTDGVDLFQAHGAMAAALPSICPDVSFRTWEPGVQPGPLEILTPPADWRITYETDDAGQPTGRVTLTEVG